VIVAITARFATRCCVFRKPFHRSLKMKTAYWIALVLVIVGAVNWGLVGLFQFDLVAALFGQASGLSRLVYSLVGLAGLALAGIAAATSGSHRYGAAAIAGH
jgi:uncharacterized protein